MATFLPATDFSTRQPYPDARRVIDAGATVALATNCNPGSSYTTSMSFVIALAVRDLHMTADRGAAGGDARRRAGAATRRRRLARPRRPAPTSSCSTRRATTHLVYRPGVPLIHDTIIGGASAVTTRHDLTMPGGVA